MMRVGLPLTRHFIVLLMLLGVALPQLASAHDDMKSASSGKQKAWGIAGDPRAAKRTIEVGMTDDMRFTPAHIEVRHGETVRFVVKNNGKLMHEFVVGTKKSLDRHANEMLAHPHMSHSEPELLHVVPGTAGEMVWNFNRVGKFDFACLIPGHYQAGMRGRIAVVSK